MVLQGPPVRIRLLVVDDHSIIRRGMKVLLGLNNKVEVVGEAANGMEAVSQVELLRPDIVLMDVRMPIMDGVAATREIINRFSDTKILILTTFDDEEYVKQAMAYGAMGYLLKDTPTDELNQAIDSVYKGYTQLGPGLGRKLINTNPSLEVPTPPPGWQELTTREKEILKLIATGANNREIAQQLYISEKTVKNHISNIFSCLNLRDRTQAAILANSLIMYL